MKLIYNYKALNFSNKMVGYKKRYVKKTYKKKPGSKKPMAITPAFTKAVKKVIFRVAETKKAVALNPSSTRGTQLENGKLIFLDSTPFYTTQGTADDMDTRIGCRIGDEVTPMGLSIRFMVSLNVRQTSASFRWMLIRHAPADAPTDSTLFQFASYNVNKQLCPVDTERFTIIAQKNFYIKADNRATGTSTSGHTAITEAAGIVNSGTDYANVDVSPLGFATRKCSVWIKGSKFGRKLTYQDGSGSLKQTSYSSVLIGYNNYQGTVPSDVGLNRGAYIAIMDDYISQFYFKDV